MPEHFGFKPEFLPNSSNIVSTNDGYFWKHWTQGSYEPPSAVRGGTDLDGSPIFVGRAYHNGDMLPCKVIPQKNVAYISWGGEELPKESCEILCQSQMHWVQASHGSVPAGAVPAGSTSSGEPLYVGRVHHNGATTIGKVHQSHSTCYIPFDGREESHPYYEVLVMSMD